MAASSPDKTSAKDMSAKDMSAKDTSADDPSADDTARATAALDRLAALHPKLIDLGLTRTFDLLDRLGNPHHRLPPVIHVAGTNGKGSVIALMRAMAEAAGLSVHVYTSPHLCRFNERIRLAGNLIADGALADLLEEVERANGDEPVTFFEVTTAAAFLAFSRSKADLLLLETGLGGALDSTNVLDRPAATVITPIARDHEHFLGSDLAGIAGQKAGIMRADTPCLCAAQDQVVMDALDSHAAVVGTRAVAVDRDILWQLEDNGGVVVRAHGNVLTLAPPGLFGHHQMQNAALAAAALNSAMPDLDFEMGGQGTATASWPGRLQRLADGHLTQIAAERAIWLDGAHNAHGASALAAALKQLSPTGTWHFVTGALNTRPPAEFLEKIAPLAASLHCVVIPDQPSSLTAHELVNAATPLFSAAQPAASIGAALSAITISDDPDNAPVMICGSLYLAGHVLAANGTLPA
jgi:dihydrofolate synthase/folylpolyglutamate synthase|tara:strand:- start:3998 stop:5395 length:1398 start_codon:yes stop_codon:yes gene_type:complete